MNVKQKMIAGLCASLVLLGSAAALPQTAVQPDYAVTVSAAEADYDWSGFLKRMRAGLPAARRSKLQMSAFCIRLPMKAAGRRA